MNNDIEEVNTGHDVFESFWNANRMQWGWRNLDKQKVMNIWMDGNRPESVKAVQDMIKRKSKANTMSRLARNNKYGVFVGSKFVTAATKRGVLAQVRRELRLMPIPTIFPA